MDLREGSKRRGRKEVRVKKRKLEILRPGRGLDIEVYMVKHFLTDLDVTAIEQEDILNTAIALKADPDKYRKGLEGKTLGMIFAKSSTRTRISFEVGIFQLGGKAVFLPTSSSQVGRGETPMDTARVLSRYLDGVMIRTFKHEEIRALANASSIPVINGLDDDYHPCQVLADLQTIKEEFGSIAGRQLVYVGDGNNMAHSLMLGGALAGLNVRIVSPKNYQPQASIVERARLAGQLSGAVIEVSDDLQAVEGADVVYTDVWTSMGQEAEEAARLAAFEGYIVDEAMMSTAERGSIFLHCLPAHRGEEVSEAVIEGQSSRVFEQVENRLHAQKALMLHLMG